MAGPNAARILEAIRPLLGPARQVSLSHLNRLLPLDLSADELDAVFALLFDEGVQVVDDSAGRPPPAPVVRAAAGADRAAEGDDKETALEPEPMVRSTVRWYKQQIGKIERLTPDQERSLGRLARSGDPRAIDDMVQANLRLVLRIARRYVHTGINFLDLVQTGNEGLLESVRRYDPDRHGPFASFGSWWIHKSISRSLGLHWSVIRIPRALGIQCRRYLELRARLHSQLGRAPAPREVCQAMGIDSDQLDLLDSLVATPVSLDVPIPGKEGVVIQDYLRDEKSPKPLEESFKSSLKGIVADLFAHLGIVEQRILVLRFGLAEDAPRSVGEVARMTGLPREEIQRVERQALQRLRAISRDMGIDVSITHHPSE